jgi:uncharacterized membrane protein
MIIFTIILENILDYNKKHKTMELFWSQFITAIITLLFLDYIWIGIIYKNNYMNAIVNVQGSELTVRYGSAIVVYLAIATMIIVWVLPRVQAVTKNKSDFLINSFKYGGLLGGLSYAVFNFTNNSIFKNWTLDLAVVDTLWGAFLTGATTYVLTL